MPFHRDLRLAGLLPPVDAPHHMRAMEWRPYREGAVVSSELETGSLIDVGLYETVSMMLADCEEKLFRLGSAALCSPTSDAAFGGWVAARPLARRKAILWRTSQPAHLQCCILWTCKHWWT